MYQLRASHFEEDVVATGVVDTFGDVISAVRSTRFGDRRNGYYRGIGGLIGDGGVLIDRYETTSVSFSLGDTSFINYEKALTGAVTLAHGDLQITTKQGIATVARQCDFDLNFRPERHTVGGIEVSLMIDALDRFLALGGETRAGAVDYRVIEDSGAGGPDGPLLGLVEHILGHFDLYGYGADTRAARLAEALVTEIFVQMLRDTGALTLKGPANAGRPGHTASTVVRRAEDYIHARFNEPVTVADVAAAAGVSIRHLQAAFRQHRETTPRQYLTSVRLDRARAMLHEAPPSIMNVALECGFVHLSRFAQAYRSRFGELPSETARASRDST